MGYLFSTIATEFLAKKEKNRPMYFFFLAAFWVAIAEQELAIAEFSIRIRES